MKTKPTLLAIALASAFPFSGAMAQTNADMQREIDQLKAQLRVLMEKVEAMSQKGGVDPQEFNRLVQKVDLAEENSITAGFQGLKFKGVIEARFTHDKNNDQTLVLAPQGVAFLDVMNPDFVRAGLVPESRRERAGATLVERRRLVGASVRKDVELRRGGSVVRAWHEEVRLYEPAELDDRIAAAGLGLQARWGGFDGSTFGPGSPRQLLRVSRAAATNGG